MIILGTIGLGVWYFFLKKQDKVTENTDVARGFGTSAPSFHGGPTGSTYQNILTDMTDGGASVPASDSSAPAGAPPQLWHVSANPTAGMGFVKNGTRLMLYFVERATGYVFAADTDSAELVRISNTLRPKTSEAIFTADGSVIERSIGDTGHIETMAATQATSTRVRPEGRDISAPLGGKTLESDIISIAVNPVANEFFYLVSAPPAGIIGIRAPWNNKTPKRTFSSALSQWQLEWLADGRIILTQNAADSVPGSSFELRSDGSLSPLVQHVSGLTVLLKSGSQALLYGTSEGGALAMYAKVDAKSPAIKIPIKTIADKCVWAPGKDPVAYCAVPQSISQGEFINSWYRGALHTSDSLWRVNVRDGSAQLLFTPASANATIDIERPLIDESGKLITFLNAADKSLWLLRLITSTSTPSTQ